MNNGVNELLEELVRTPGLPGVEEIITSSFRSSVRELSEVPRHLFGLGGKRLRPIVTLISGLGFGSDSSNEQLLTLAAGIELIHLASLLHDDVIDQSALRRHQPSAFSLFGSDRSILAGDFLFVRAFGLCAKLDKFIIRRTEEACVSLTEGEILESLGDFSVEAALRIGARKTAALFSLACEGGAYLAGAAEDSVGHMRAVGAEMGMAFQIVDDILDITQSAEKLGKPPGGDLRERRPSLVNAIWLQNGSKLAQRWSEGSLNQTEQPSAITEILQSGVVEAAREYCFSKIALARQSLSLAAANIESNQWLMQLNRLLDLVATRDF